MYNQAVLLGILISLGYSELTGLSAGLIIPGYLALNLHSPQRIAYTLIISLAAMGVCKLLSRVVILYGRRRFAAMVIVSFALSSFVGWTGFLPGGFDVIGYLIPGIIAREMDSQGVGKTLLSIAVTTGILAMLLLLLGYPVGR